MLSQTLPDEIIISDTYMPPRLKSAYVKLVSDVNHPADLNSPRNQQRFNNLASSKRDPQNEGPQKYFRYRSSQFKNDDSYDGSRPATPENEFVEYQQQSKPSARDIVTARNTAERMDELERTNLNLKRMLQFVINDPTQPINRIGCTTPRLLSHRQSFNMPVGPPTLRQGRIGSSWRHIKQTNNYSNSNLLFIDGTVRLNDSSRYPPRLYGYPPKIVQNSADLIGLSTQSLANIDLPIGECIRNRPMNLRAYDNQFHERAKTGFEYWNKDRRLPENNKTKDIVSNTRDYSGYVTYSLPSIS